MDEQPLGLASMTSYQPCILRRARHGGVPGKVQTPVDGRQLSHLQMVDHCWTDDARQQRKNPACLPDYGEKGRCIAGGECGCGTSTMALAHLVVQAFFRENPGAH